MDEELTTSERERQEIARLGLKDLLFFNKVILGYKDIDEEVHGEWEHFKKGSKKKMKLILVPREHFKTSFFTIGETIQDILKNPNERILLANAVLGNAQSFLREIKEHIQRNEKLRYYYPEVKEWEAGATKWTEKQIIISRTRVGKEPTIEATGVGGNLVSQHYDKIKLDDLVSLENCATRLQAEKVIDYFKYCLSLLETDGELTIIGTRWAYYELYQYIIDNLKQDFNILVRGCWKDKEKTIPYFPGKFSKEKLDELRRMQGSYIFSCLPKEALILMADWTEKEVSEIQVGEEVIGWDEKEEIGKRKKKALCPSKVLSIGKRKAKIIKVKLASGRIVRCTPDHKWLRYLAGHKRNHWFYHPAEKGKKMMFVCRQEKIKMTEREIGDAKWLAGIFDGEGSSDKFTIRIAQSKKHNPEICYEIERILNYFNFKYSYNEFGIGKGGVYWINGGLGERARFLKIYNPITKNKIYRTLFEKDFVKEKDEIIEITPEKEITEVYNIQTKTENYIADGFCSHNCQYQNEPLDIETAIFKKSSFKYYDKIPELIYITTTVDPNLSEKLKSNYGVILTLGQDIRTNLYVLDIIREKMNPNMLINRMLLTQLKWKPKIIGVEQNALQKTLGYFFDEVLSHRKINLPIVPIHVDNQKSKEMRISALQPLFEQGKIFFPKEHPHLKDLEGELIKFPLAATDDIADALSSQLQFTQPPESPKELKPDYPVTLQDKVFKEQKEFVRQKPGIRHPSSGFVDETLGCDY